MEEKIRSAAGRTAPGSSSCQNPALLAFLLLGSCHDSTQLMGGDAGVEAPSADSPTGQSVPINHRAVATACVSARPLESSCVAIGPSFRETSDCSQGSDCAAGANGRCIAQMLLPIEGNKCTCTYDQCSSDVDCPGTTLCQCAEDTANARGNRCLRGNCRTDADCGDGGFCSPSRDKMAVNVNASSPESFIGYYCHTKADTCVNDTECRGTYGAHCAYDPAVMAWGCIPYWIY